MSGYLLIGQTHQNNLQSILAFSSYYILFTLPKKNQKRYPV